VLLLAALAAACSDNGIVDVSTGFPVALSVQPAAAVSQAEVDALGEAFDRVDSYTVVVRDSINGTTIATRTVSVSAGQSSHTLDLVLPSSTAGLAVGLSIVAHAGDLELYRSDTYARVQPTTDPTPVVAPIRYTGPGLRGTVRDDSGAGLGDVDVSLFQGATLIASTTTEPDGTYLFLPTNQSGDLGLGAYQVEPTPPGALFVCPVLRNVDVQSTDASLVADFVATSATCQIDVLVVSGGDVDDTQVVADMFADAPNVAASTFFYVNQLPGLEVLEQYDVVLLFANGLFDESGSLGSQIRDYVDLGGNVVFGSFYWQDRSDGSKGSVGWGALEDVDPFMSTGGATYKAATLGQVTSGDLPTGDQLVAGLDSLTSTGFRGGVSAKPETTVVAEWSDATPLIGYRILPEGQRLVGVSLFPASGTAAGGNTLALWENAVRWTGEAGGPLP